MPTRCAASRAVVDRLLALAADREAAPGDPFGLDP
jgi:hypothetical protein